MGQGKYTINNGVCELELFVTAVKTPLRPGQTQDEKDQEDKENAEAWERAFNKGSEILFEATNHYMQIKKIHFLDQGPTGSSDDIFLKQQTTVPPKRSSATGHCGMKKTNKVPLTGYVTLYPYVIQGPNSIVHELSHYVTCLRDEYAIYGGSVFRVCTNSSNKDVCFMEFGPSRGYQLDADGFSAASQPPHPVVRYCEGNYLTDTNDDHLSCIDNGVPNYHFNEQQSEYGHSCWSTIKTFFDNVEDTVGTETHQPIEWIVRSNEEKFALAILGTDSLSNNGLEFAIKNTAKASIGLISSGEHQLALLANSFSGDAVRNMAPVAQENDDSVLDLIDEAIFGGTPAPLGPGDDNVASPTNQFGGVGGSFQHLALMANGDHSDENLDLAGLARELEQANVKLTATTYGDGVFADQLEELSAGNKWVDHQSVPQKKDAKESGFDLQNDWLERFFAMSADVSGVASYGGELPAPLDMKGMQGEPIELDQAEQRSTDPFSFEIRDSGFDFPVFIEQGATSAFFVLSEPVKENIDIKLVAPSGEEILNERGIKKSRMGDNITWFEVPIDENRHGRWVIRLKRKGGDNPLPFHLFVATKDDFLSIHENVIVDGNKVRFECNSHYRERLDFVDTRVDIYMATAKAINPTELFQSIVLQRRSVYDTVTGSTVQVSTGEYEGELDLKPGEYIAVFHAVNNGCAVEATNPTASPRGEVVNTDSKPVPAFQRVIRRRFKVK